jgi:hypothetical protein
MIRQSRALTPIPAEAGVVVPHEADAYRAYPAESTSCSGPAAERASSLNESKRLESVLPPWRFKIEFHRFLTELSERPGRAFAISTHLLPRTRCWRISVPSSACVHGVFLTDASRWFWEGWGWGGGGGMERGGA